MKKIYTKRGDGGKTMMMGKMINKDELAVEAVGMIDELNSWIGVCRNELRMENGELRILDKELKRIQTNLFTIGSRLSGSSRKINLLETGHLEKLIDRLSKDLPELSNFIYPVGELQVARAVARRAERTVVKIFKEKKDILKYMNRLSDALFVMGRWVNWQRGIKEEIVK